MRAVLAMLELAALALAIAGAGCSPPEGRFACTEDDECPLGWSCVGGYCYSSRHDVGASDAGLDAAIDGVDAPGLDAPDACVGSSDDPLRCGPDCVVCPTVEGGVSTCEAGDCVVRCTAPHALVPSRTGGAPRCAQFGGLYVEGAASSCPAPNPFTGACTCPAGFIDTDLANWRMRDTDPVSTRIHGCQVEDPMQQDAWGGMFLRNETSSTCVVPNPLSPTSVCNCHPDFDETASMFGLNASENRLRLTFCRRGAAVPPAGTLATAFTEVSASATGCVAGTCITSGSSCECPAGTTAEVIESLARNPTGAPVCEAESTYCVPTF